MRSQGQPAPQQSAPNAASGPQQATSRRQGAPLGSNRYSKRGILLPDSSSYSSSPNSRPHHDHESRPVPQQMVSGACSRQGPIASRKHQPGAQPNQVEPSHLINNEALRSPQASRVAAARGLSGNNAEDSKDDKTVEQAGTRQLNNTVKFLSTQDANQQVAKSPNRNRLDTSGFDINFGSEMDSPLSKKLHMTTTGSVPHETGLLKLKSTNFREPRSSGEGPQQQHQLLYNTLENVA